MNLDQEGKTVFYQDKPHWVMHDAPVIAYKEGVTGFWPIWTKRKASELNDPEITEAILESAQCASMFGWSSPAAELAKKYCDEKRGVQHENKA